MKKEFVTLKEALPGFVAECIKVANRENAKLMDFHVYNRRSLNYYLKQHIMLSLYIDKGEIKERTRRTQHVLQDAYGAIDMLSRRKFSDYYRVIFYEYRCYLLDTEGEDMDCDLSPVMFGVMLYIYEMLDEDNFIFFRLTSEAWNEEYQSNDIYKRLKNDKELADLANRKVWRLWTEEDDDKEVEDVEKEEAGKEEAGKEITSGESNSQEGNIDKYFNLSRPQLEQMQEAVNFCKTKSDLAILKLVLERKKYTSCISNHKLFIDTLCDMELVNKEDKPLSCMKYKYYKLINKDYKWPEEDNIIYDELMKIFDK